MMGMSERDYPVHLDKLSSDWLKELADGEYQRQDLEAHEWAERYHFECERRDDRRRRRRMSWESREDFGE